MHAYFEEEQINASYTDGHAYFVIQEADNPSLCYIARLPDYQLTPSQWGASGGSATHKEPTQAPSADSTHNQVPDKMAANSPPLSLASQCMSGKPISICQGLTC
jgi:hypothetical protein